MYIISITNIVYLRDGVPSLAVTGEVVLPVNLVDIRLFNILIKTAFILYHVTRLDSKQSIVQQTLRRAKQHFGSLKLWYIMCRSPATVRAPTKATIATKM